MKKINILAIALLAAAPWALLAPSAHAQSTISYNEGDLLLGFENYSNTAVTGSNYIIDLGPASYFLGLKSTDAAGTVINLTTTDPAHDGQSQVGLGNLASDLASIYGPSWYSNNGAQGSNLQWGVAGGSDPNFNNSPSPFPKSTVFLTLPEFSLGAGTTAPSTFNEGGQNSWDNNIQAVAGNSGGWYGDTSLTDNAYGATEPNGSTDSWSAGIGGDTSSNAFGTGFNIEQPLAGNNIGPTDSELDLYELIPTGETGNVGGKGTELGTFTLDSSGDLFYTVVPEPSTYAAIGIGAAFLLIFRRRRTKSLA